MSTQTQRIQPYWADDGDYVTLVDFVLQMVPLLDSEFRPPDIWSERTTESVPCERDVTCFIYGDAERGVKVQHTIHHDAKAHGDAEDEVLIACFGLSERTSLELRAVRPYHDQRFIEIQVAGPDNAVNHILERFNSHFQRESSPNGTSIPRLIETARVAARLHAWRVVETNALEVLKHDEQNSEALMYLGLVKAAQGFEPEGENLLLASLTFNPRNHNAYYNLGFLALQQGRCMFASDAFRHGLTIDPANHSLLFQLGRALERLGMTKEALESYQQALLHSPKPNQGWETTGMNFAEDSRRAIERLESSSGSKTPDSEKRSCTD
jgi:tetratricopeptide (TPR) repeat protein